MQSLTPKVLAAVLVASCTPLSMAADSIGAALKESTPSGDFNLRYEDVDVPATDSDGLTLRSRIGLKTGTYEGFSALVEVEDVRDVLGIDDQGGLIPDPEVTEIDQAFIQYKTDALTAKLGRQVITLDGHRYVGHVGWRQDRQTFDAARFSFAPVKGLDIDATYVYQRNRIFAETADAKSSDLLLNAAYKTPVGKLVGYGYLLDDETTGAESDTFGLSLTGSKDSFLYHLEYATQDIDSRGGDSPDYLFAEVGLKLAGVTAKLGYEVLGADGTSSFTTPLATLHKFNGWNDIFLGGTFGGAITDGTGLGLEDSYLSVGGKVAGIGLTAVYHDYSSDTGSSDYGSEWGFVATKAFDGGYNLGLKYSSYDADTYAQDTDKLWVWAGYKF